jgi:hypothetical protein
MRGGKSANIMLAGRKLVVDRFSYVFELLEDYIDDEFYGFDTHQIIPSAIYVISRTQLGLNVDAIRKLVENNTITLVLSDPFEGSIVMKNNCRRLGIEDLVTSQQISIITGGDIEPTYRSLTYDFFMTKVLAHADNLPQIARYQQLQTVDRPYKFLFLNGRSRSHRKYLLEYFKLTGLLDQSIWTNLDTVPAVSQKINLWHEERDLLSNETAIHLLDSKYEYSGHTKQELPESGFVKYKLFKDVWADIYLQADAYLDTYFSLVTETVFEYPYSFRTEKIWKPVAIGHPFIVAANCGYYRDLHNLGFKTFGHLIDESFDLIDNDQTRIEQVAEIVQDLCKQDLQSFITAAKDVCEYNQQHLAETSLQVEKTFVPRFLNFVLDSNK